MLKSFSISKTAYILCTRMNQTCGELSSSSWCVNLNLTMSFCLKLYSLVCLCMISQIIIIYSDLMLHGEENKVYASSPNVHKEKRIKVCQRLKVFILCHTLYPRRHAGLQVGRFWCLSRRYVGFK